MSIHHRNIPEGLVEPLLATEIRRRHLDRQEHVWSLPLVTRQDNEGPRVTSELIKFHAQRAHALRTEAMGRWVGWAISRLKTAVHDAADAARPRSEC